MLSFLQGAINEIVFLITEIVMRVEKHCEMIACWKG